MDKPVGKTATRRRTPKIDPATVEVVRHYLVSAAREMERTLVRTAYTTIIYEIKDFGLSIFDKNLELLADSTGLPLFLGANEFAMRNTLEHGNFGTLEPGDVILMNIPYLACAHTNDGVLIMPVFHEDEIVAYTVARGHWTDLGGKDPGYILDSTSVHQEGIMIPGVKLYEKGKPNEAVLSILRTNSRAPATIMGDMNAQTAALRTGTKRVEELFAKYGKRTVEGCIREILDHGEAEAKAALGALPDGEWEAENWMDNDGITEDPVRIHVKVTKKGEEMIFDFSGSSDQVAGPVNLSFGMTQSAARIAFKSVTTPEEASNGGQFRPCTAVAPPGNLFHAVYPAPVFTIWAGVVGLETVYMALAKGLPELVPAGSGGDLGDPGFYGNEPVTGRHVWHQTNAGVGWGAKHDRDGLNTTHHISMSTVKNIPVEVVESRLPVMVDRAGFRPDSGGPGKYRGGLGSMRDYRFLGPFGALTILKKSATEGWGVDGGRPGPKNLSVLIANTDNEGWEKHWENDIVVYADYNAMYGNTDSSKYYCGMFRGEFWPGDVISYLADGGGGYGDPFERDPDHVLDDVIDGYVSITKAREDYGVAITGDLRIDEEETRRLRRRGS